MALDHVELNRGLEVNVTCESLQLAIKVTLQVIFYEKASERSRTLFKIGMILA